MALVSGPWRVSTCGLVSLAALALLACAQPSPEQEIGKASVFLVLPFEVEGQEDGAGYVGLATARSFAATLERAAGIQVLEVPETAAEPEAAGETHRITGMLSRDGESVLARVEMGDASGRSVLWETEMSWPVGDLSGLAFRLAKELVRANGISYPALYDYIGDLTGGPGMAESPLTEQAREAWRTSNREALLEASAGLVERFADDPAAHALSAWASMLAWDQDPSREEPLARLKERLATLARLDPSSPYDEFMLGYIYRSSGQAEEARVLYSRLLSRTDLSTVARSWALRQRSYTYAQAGNAEAARDDAEESVRLDPAHASGHVALSRALEALDLLDDAISSSRRALALQPDSWRQHQRLGLVLSRAGRHEEAVRSLDRACDMSGSQEACANLSVALIRGRDERRGRSVQAAAESMTASPWGYYNLACFSALAGERALAIERLRRSLDLGFADLLINTDPDLDSLRGDPEFQAIVTAVEERLSSRQQLSMSAFPWQARLSNNTEAAFS
jgi:tetratricopeptide (TPR) repeat protein